MPETFDSIKKQFEAFLLADQAGRLAQSAKLASLLQSYFGNEAGKEMVRAAIVESVIDIVSTFDFMRNAAVLSSPDSTTRTGAAEPRAASLPHPGPANLSGHPGSAAVVRALRFDGLYYAPGSQLRFYENGDVISVGSSGTPEQVGQWFSRRHEGVLRGQYDQRGTELSFSVTAREGALEFRGIIDGERLLLHCNSRINGHQSDRIYNFVPLLHLATD